MTVITILVSDKFTYIDITNAFSINSNTFIDHFSWKFTVINISIITLHDTTKEQMYTTLLLY